MADPTIFEQFRGIFDAFQMVVSLGLLTSFIYHISESVDHGWWERSPDGYIPGVVESGRHRAEPAYLGLVPEALAGGVCIIGGFALYTSISMVVIWALFFSSLLYGESFPTQPYFYFAAAMGLIYTIYLQGELRRAVDFSQIRLHL